jgi:hypothetical protein
MDHILRDAAKWPLLQDERNCVRSGDDGGACGDVTLRCRSETKASKGDGER